MEIIKNKEGLHYIKKYFLVRTDGTNYNNGARTIGAYNSKAEAARELEYASLGNEIRGNALRYFYQITEGYCVVNDINILPPNAVINKEKEGVLR